MTEFNSRQVLVLKALAEVHKQGIGLSRAGLDLMLGGIQNNPVVDEVVASLGDLIDGPYPDSPDTLWFYATPKGLDALAEIQNK